MYLPKLRVRLIMSMPEQIIKQQKFINRCEKQLNLEKLKKRRADT